MPLNNGVSIFLGGGAMSFVGGHCPFSFYAHAGRIKYWWFDGEAGQGKWKV